MISFIRTGTSLSATFACEQQQRPPGGVRPQALLGLGLSDGRKQ